MLIQTFESTKNVVESAADSLTSLSSSEDIFSFTNSASTKNPVYGSKDSLSNSSFMKVPPSPALRRVRSCLKTNIRRQVSNTSNESLASVGNSSSCCSVSEGKEKRDNTHDAEESDFSDLDNFNKTVVDDLVTSAELGQFLLETKMRLENEITKLKASVNEEKLKNVTLNENNTQNFHYVEELKNHLDLSKTVNYDLQEELNHLQVLYNQCEVRIKTSQYENCRLLSELEYLKNYVKTLEANQDSKNDIIKKLQQQLLELSAAAPAFLSKRKSSVLFIETENNIKTQIEEKNKEDALAANNVLRDAKSSLEIVQCELEQAYGLIEQLTKNVTEYQTLLKESQFKCEKLQEQISENEQLKLGNCYLNDSIGSELNEITRRKISSEKTMEKNSELNDDEQQPQPQQPQRPQPQPQAQPQQQEQKETKNNDENETSVDDSEFHDYFLHLQIQKARLNRKMKSKSLWNIKVKEKRNLEEIQTQEAISKKDKEIENLKKAASYNYETTKELQEILKKQEKKQKEMEEQKTLNEKAKEKIESEKLKLENELAILKEKNSKKQENALKESMNTVSIAAEKMKSLLNTSKKNEDSNHSMLLSSAVLVDSVQELISISSIVQSYREQTQPQSKNNNGEKDSYLSNNRWSEGLISASKAVAWCVQTLVEHVDEAVKNGSDSEVNKLIVASHEIVASTAQLVISSWVKTESNDKKSKESSNSAAYKRKQELESASKNVNTNAKKLVEEAQNMLTKQKVSTNAMEDAAFVNMSSMKIKRMEMEIKVKILNLEGELQKQRQTLGKLRKGQYNKK